MINDDKVDFSYMLNYSIVDSEESYSYIYNPPEIIGKKHFRIFDILGYESLIVVGVYRRYAEWIVSGYSKSIKKTVPLSKCQRADKESSLLAFQSVYGAATKKIGERNVRIAVLQYSRSDLAGRTNCGTTETGSQDDELLPAAAF